MSDSTAAAGRDGPANEIKITAEMIEAGAAAVRAYDSRFEDEEGLAEEVFSRMIRIAKGAAGSCRP